MSREFERHPGGEHAIRILSINDEAVADDAMQRLIVRNIGKGGFRFECECELQLEDRVKVLLSFPDGYQQEVLGRICYADEQDNNTTAYGFSIISGFYSMRHAVA